MFENEVAQGIRALDEDGPPDWRDRVDLTTLNMAHADRCVLGQVYQSYWSPEAEVLKERHNVKPCGFYVDTDCDCDFYHDDDESNPCNIMPMYRELTAEWRRQLAFVPTAA